MVPSGYCHQVSRAAPGAPRFTYVRHGTAPSGMDFWITDLPGMMNW